MENLIISANVMLPLCLLLVLGYVLRLVKLVNERSVLSMNALVFRVFMPFLIFKNVYSINLTEGIRPGIFLFAAIGVLVLFGVLFLLVPRFEKENPRRGVLIQGIARSNFALFGLSVAESLYGVGNAGITALLSAVVIPMFNVLSVIALSVYGSKKCTFKKVLKDIVTNPLIIGTALGLVFLFLDIPLPTFLSSFVDNVAKIATPLAFIVLGASFSFEKLRGNGVTLTIGVSLRLVWIPLIACGIGYFLGFRGQEMLSILVIFGSPTAVNSFTMAQQMGGDGDLAAQHVLFTSVLSIFSMFLWIFIFKSLGIF